MALFLGVDNICGIIITIVCCLKSVAFEDLVLSSGCLHSSLKAGLGLFSVGECLSASEESDGELLARLQEWQGIDLSEIGATLPPGLPGHGASKHSRFTPWKVSSLVWASLRESLILERKTLSARLIMPNLLAYAKRF